MTFINEDKFELEKDYITAIECDCCGWYEETDEEVEECPECCSPDVSVYTFHEDAECDCCGRCFDLWEDCWRNTENDEMICDNCCKNGDYEE